MNPRRAACVGLGVLVFGCTEAQHGGNASTPPSAGTAVSATGNTSAIGATASATAATPSAAPGSSARPPARDLEADVKRLMELLAEVSAIHIRALPSSARATPPPGKTLDERLAGEPNCTVLTEQLDVWERAHGAELRAIPALTYGAVERDPISRQHMHNQMEVVMTLGMKCRDNPDFQALQQRLLAPTR